MLKVFFFFGYIMLTVIDLIVQVFMLKEKTENIFKVWKLKCQPLTLLLGILVRETHLLSQNFSNNDSSNAWLIDGGCTHHMCHNAAMFRNLDETYSSKVKVGIGEHVKVKGWGMVTHSDILFVPHISQNQLSVVQMLEKYNSLQLKDNQCTIFDPSGETLTCVKMKGKSFAVNWEQAAYHLYACTTQSISNLWHSNFQIFKISMSFLLAWRHAQPIQ